MQRPASACAVDDLGYALHAIIGNDFKRVKLSTLTSGQNMVFPVVAGFSLPVTTIFPLCADSCLDVKSTGASHLALYGRKPYNGIVT